MPGPVHEVEIVVIGAGQAGLSAAYFLAHRGFRPWSDFVVLDANEEPGGAWRHRWPSLTMAAVHGVHSLPGMPLETPEPEAPANLVMGSYFRRYEHAFDLPVLRPVPVRSVRDTADGRLVIESTTSSVASRALINATGTWTKPFWPNYPGMGTFGGRHLHTADYRSAQELVGKHVVVVGGGHSAVQLLAEISTVTTTTWVSRRPPQWRDTPFDEEAGRAAVALVHEAVAEGRRPPSVVNVTGLVTTPPVEDARRRGALDRLPMFDRITASGVAWDDGRFVPADVILWATGFRHALDHLAPLRLRSSRGGIPMDGTHVAGDERIHLLGYGPSASTIGANRAARAAVAQLRRHLGSPTAA